MRRKMMDKLIAWKNRGHDRLPLILYGARQVGKTHLIEEFGREHFKNRVYINFELSPSLQAVFKEDLSPDRIIQVLETISDEEIIPGQTLIFLDEIQACPKALTALKYFAERASEFHIIAAGSLLGVAVRREEMSFPVGKVELETLYPLDFEEFLWALKKDGLARAIRESFNTDSQLSTPLHDKAFQLFRSYLCTGGMPAAVLEYVTTNSLVKVPVIQNNILTAYVADMAKYASAAETVKIRTAFDSIPAQLAKENHKFQYKLLKRGATASHFGSAIDWLKSAGIVNQCRRTEAGKMPPSAYVDISAFKLYMGDIGLLVAKSGLPHQSILLSSESVNDFKGAVTENYLAQALVTNGYEIFYWESDYTAEVDFVIVRNGDVIPLESKAATHTKSKSLNVYIQKYNPPYAIRLSGKNFGFENNIKSVPLYGAFCL